MKLHLYKETNRVISFQRTALLIMSAVALPLFIAVLLFEWNAVKTSRANVRAAFASTLSAYRNIAEDSADTVQRYVADVAANSMDFQMLAHAKSKTEAYLASVELEEKCRLLLQAHELLGGFYIYSSAFDYCHAIHTANYSHTDLDSIKAAVMETASLETASGQWIPFALSDKTVFLYPYVKSGTVFCALIDPSMQSHSGLEAGSKIFFTSKEGVPLAKEAAFGDCSFPAPIEWEKVFCTKSGSPYDLIHLPLQIIPGQIVYAVPHKSFFEQLSLLQRFLMAVMLCLLISIPICWLMLRSLLLQPLTSLSETTSAIKAGHTDTRVPQDSNIYEVNSIAETVNTMLDTIQQQKIEAYERELSVRDLQLQYLQLQLRPHFFLNCLKLIYSLAGEKEYDILQELTLHLSAYLRSIFKDGSRLIPLSDEINSIKSYMRIQETGMQFPPRLKLSMNPDTAEILIPPISVLTFVENAIKHADPINDTLFIRIKCEILGSEEGNYLYITVCDNGGGFPKEKLKELNDPEGKAAAEGHIGISNIRRRLQFLYEGRATISFRNRSDGACVELFIPTESPSLCKAPVIQGKNDNTGGDRP